ncbi:MAG TPA: hypothetical protein VHX88_20905 [Solirubrobacteraceae bacterium]|nr:hypothetical protein [Solirubrobacteraceae bacterium]
MAEATAVALGRARGFLPSRRDERVETAEVDFENESPKLGVFQCDGIDRARRVDRRSRFGGEWRMNASSMFRRRFIASTTTPSYRSILWSR